MDLAEPLPRDAAVAHAGFFLLKAVNQAIREYGMIQDGDRIAVAVSGGKDSLGLLKLLQQRQSTAGERYELVAVHVLGDAGGLIEAHPPLLAWLARHAPAYRIVEPELGPAEKLPLDCQRCSWLRRKALFTAAGELGCNVVAFAHHADDAAQTTLMNLLYGGNVRTLKAVAQYFGGRFRLIRPLLYVPESEMARFARLSGFPPPPPGCLHGDTSRRRLMAGMLRLLGRDYMLQARTNLIRAGLAGNAQEPVDLPAETGGHKGARCTSSR